MTKNGIFLRKTAQYASMPRALSDEQRKRREESQLPAQLTLQKQMLANIDGVPLALVEGEQEALHILLFSERSITIEGVRTTYDNARVVCIGNTLHENKPGYLQELSKEYYQLVGLSKPKEIKNSEERKKALIDLHKRAKEALHLASTPSYEKVQNDLVSLEFMGLAASRKDGNAVVWRASEEFYSKWVERRVQLLTQIRKKEIHESDLPTALRVFYHLGAIPRGTMRMIFQMFEEKNKF